jgi:hypothetical protein
LLKRFQKKKLLLEPETVYARFWTGWLRVMARGWDLEGLCTLARVGTVVAFIQKISPPTPFVYYMHVFHRCVNDERLFHELFLWCFIQPLLTSPIEYGVAMNISESDKLEFLDALVGRPEYFELLTALIVAEVGYPVLRLDNHQEDLAVLLKYKLERPPSVDTISWPTTGTLANQLGLSADPGEWHQAVRSRWILPIGRSVFDRPASIAPYIGR